MQTLTDSQSAVVQGGGKFVTLNLNVSPTIVAIPQVNAGAVVAIFGARAILLQGNSAGVKA
jgi:hypothetical protein